ncbi:uncharacterized protein LOC120270418 isoform X1 [Dioscorea cayenensis subsp. rotundata]|uniref:Uncharacterized protein LOC120270418 isoform X1 n=1 Tax=Dioscorea cayennensis subsp. rotundata TaxID=55577 RepID=A0AB40C4N7_DIOCR|nr:uncharacterized protein LOC120270418 isoform X1 [Dioscorea cayenensis subsp. rotundata]
MLKFRFVPEETTKMRLLASAPGGHSNAAQVFVYIPLRTSTPFASSPARNGASRLHRQRPTPPWNLSVHDLRRRSRPISSNSRSFIPMSRTCSPRTGFLPSRKNHEGYIPQSCTAASSLSPSSPPQLPLLLQSRSPVVSAHLTPHDAPQRSEEWFALRKDKLTTSTFSTALGFWKGNRRSELWHQKVFIPDEIVFEAAAKAAMDWGVSREPAAIEQYKAITGREVGSLGFAIHAEARYGWLGASPDGLIGLHPDAGILEVKCPYNKGKPELALPWQVMPYYYMPQVQGQMEIMDRDWVDLYCWTPNGSALFRVLRDRSYWELMHGILRDFWWNNVVPAREAVLMGREDEAKVYEPKPKHGLTGFIIGRSRKLAAEARLLCRDIGGHLEFFQ